MNKFQQGHIEYFALEEWRTCSRYRHACGAVGLHCDISGARALLLDERRRAHVYSAPAAELCALPARLT